MTLTLIEKFNKCNQCIALHCNVTMWSEETFEYTHWRKVKQMQPSQVMNMCRIEWSHFQFWLRNIKTKSKPNLTINFICIVGICWWQINTIFMTDMVGICHGRPWLDCCLSSNKTFGMGVVCVVCPVSYQFVNVTSDHFASVTFNWVISKLVGLGGGGVRREEVSKPDKIWKKLPPPSNKFGKMWSWSRKKARVQIKDWKNLRLRRPPFPNRAGKIYSQNYWKGNPKVAPKRP